MNRSRPLALLLSIALGISALACERREAESGEDDRDTLSIEVPDIDAPENVDERLEEGARRVGGRIGEAIEETGEAIEDAGERVQEEAGETTPDDTL
jgi:hypothetical protein